MASYVLKWIWKPAGWAEQGDLSLSPQRNKPDKKDPGKQKCQPSAVPEPEVPRRLAFVGSLWLSADEGKNSCAHPATSYLSPNLSSHPEK